MLIKIIPFYNRARITLAKKNALGYVPREFGRNDPATSGNTNVFCADHFEKDQNPALAGGFFVF